MAKLTSIIGNSQKLDGGAMFGHVPKAMWSKWTGADEKNRIQLACRALLIEDNEKTILLETGVGAFFDPVLRERYGVQEEEHVLLNALHARGIAESDIDFIILSHLHFDHAGGLLSVWQENTTAKLLFPKAKYFVSKIGWERACNPHIRDKASFLPQLNTLLSQSNRLILIDKEQHPLLGLQYQFSLTYGHTPGLLHTHFKSSDARFIFASDLIPGTHWIHLPVCMGYDRSPELLIEEKQMLLDRAIKENMHLFYTHDPDIAWSRVAKDNKGKYFAIDTEKNLLHHH